MKRTLILGVGNLLLSDEGIGVHVVQEMLKKGVPPDVEILDGGTGGFELIEHLRGRKRVVIVDCLLADAPPGSIIRALPDDLDLQWEEPFSSHQGGLRSLLQHAKVLPCPSRDRHHRGRAGGHDDSGSQPQRHSVRKDGSDCHSRACGGGLLMIIHGSWIMNNAHKRIGRKQCRCPFSTFHPYRACNHGEPSGHSVAS